LQEGGLSDAEALRWWVAETRYFSCSFSPRFCGAFSHQKCWAEETRANTLVGTPEYLAPEAKNEWEI
jgi:hypothetical protein